MYELIEQLANDKGISADDANYIFAALTSHLVSKIPALSQVIEDVFTNVDAEELKEHINRLIILLQKQGIEKMNSWSMPTPWQLIKQTGIDHIL